jgi:hypothetical protein
MHIPKRALIATLVLCLTATAAMLASPAAAGRLVESLRSNFAAPDAADRPQPPAPAPAAAQNVASFHFLEPLAARSGDPSKFDPTLLNNVTVEVCEVTSAGCSTVKTFTSAGAASEQLRIESSGGWTYYIVNWDTVRVALNNKTYRVRVIYIGLELGSIDLTPDVYTRFGRTWPIKFLIEKDPALRLRRLVANGLTLWEIAAALRAEFGICGNELGQLLLDGVPSVTQAQVQMVLSGVCQNPVIPATTKIADAQTRAALILFDPDTGAMQFSAETALLKTLRTGDVLVGQMAPAAPYGFLRKVTSYRKQYGQVYLTTVAAKLKEAISSGQLDATGELRPSGAGAAAGIQSFKGGLGVQSLDEGDTFTFQKDVDVTIDLAAAGGGAQGTGTVRVQGSVFFNAGYNLGLGVESCFEVPPVCVDRVEAWAGVDQRSSLKVTGRFDGTLNKEQVIDRVPLSPIVFFIGPFPVVLVPVVNVVLGVDGDAHVNFTFDSAARSKVKVGAKWTDPDDNGVGWENISEYTPLGGAFVSATLNGNIRLEAYGKVDAKLLLYGAFGPGMEARVGVEAKAQTNRRPLWSIFGAVKSRVSVGADAGGFFDIGEVWDKDILDKSFLIKEADNQPPVFTDVRQGWIPVPINTNVVLGPRAGSLQGYFNVFDPEGDVPTVTASSTLDGAIPLTYKFTSAGRRTITLTARDGQGTTSTETLLIEVTNSLPIVDIRAASFTVPSGVQFFPTATAYDPENGYLTCDRLSWYVTAPDTVVQRNRNGTCAATVIFNQEGLRALTVNAVDANGATGSSTVYVNVTPRPDNLPPVIDPDSFTVQAFRGPISPECPTGLYCETKDDRTYYNGQTGDYDGALFMRVNATDPEGQPVTYRWYCETGTQQGVVTGTGVLGNGFYSCQEPIVVPDQRIRVYAIVSDGVSETRTEVRTLYIPRLLN